MPAYARSHIMPPDEVSVYHCKARCVRRAFLRSVDPLTNHDCDYRKEWIRERLELLASVFAIDICGYAVMSNHLHIVLRARPDLVRDWSDEEVALRWTRLCPPRDPATGEKTEPSAYDLNGSRQPSADPMRWWPWLHAGARPGTKAEMPLPWPFDSRPLGHRASPTDGWSARIAS
jgi:hypothetical protein